LYGNKYFDGTAIAERCEALALQFGSVALQFTARV
jgi:hypothetical protein